jgi:hypothetical protein
VLESKAERTRVTNSKFDERIATIEENSKQAIKEGKSSFQVNKFRGELRKVKVQQKSFNQMYNKGKR